MIELLFGAEHGGYIAAAYAATFLVLAGMAAYTFASRARRRRRLRELEDA